MHILNHKHNNHNKEEFEITSTPAPTTITSYFPSKTTESSFYDDYTNEDKSLEGFMEEDDLSGILNGEFLEDPTTDRFGNLESETVTNKNSNSITTESPNHNSKISAYPNLSGNQYEGSSNDNQKYTFSENKPKSNIFNPETYAYTSPSPPTNTANKAVDMSLLDANSNLNDNYDSVRTKIKDQFNENHSSMTGQKEGSVEHDESLEEYTDDIVHRTLHRNNHNSHRAGSTPTRWPDTSNNKVNVEGKHDKTSMTLDNNYEETQEEYAADYGNDDEYENNRIDIDLKKKLLGKSRNDRGPISDEEMLIMQVKSISNEGVGNGNAEDLKKDKMQINPEKLAYILIGVCCGLSLLCLIVVAVSIGYKSETHYRLEDDSSALNTKDRRRSGGNKNGGRKNRGNISSSNFSSGCDESTTSSHTSDADEIDTEGQRSSGDDLSAMKLGPWFNGKNQTIDRKNIKFPTSVYLDRLEGSDQETKERRISTNSEDIIKSAAADIDQNASPNNNTENNSLLSRDTLQSEDPNDGVDLDAITNANTLANEAKLPEKERKALIIKNQTEQLLNNQNSSQPNKSHKYSNVQDKINIINNPPLFNPRWRLRKTEF